MRRIKLVLAMAAVLVGMLAALPGPAMADHTQRHENRQDRLEDRWDERWDRWDDVEFEVEEFEVDDIEVDDFSWFWFAPVVLVIEDIDCDGIDDHSDDWIDDCEVEVEVVEWWD